MYIYIHKETGRREREREREFERFSTTVSIAGAVVVYRLHWYSVSCVMVFSAIASFCVQA